MSSTELRDLPEWISDALSEIECPGELMEEFVRGFESSLGAIDVYTLMSAVEQRSPIYWKFAVFALGYLATPEAHSILIRQLGSSDDLVRGLAALALGKAGNPFGNAELRLMLTTFPPSSATTLLIRDEEKWLYGRWRIEAASLLGASGDWQSVQALRRALEASLESRRQQVDTVPLEVDDNVSSEDGSLGFQDECLYALGRLGAFGALTGMRDEAREFYVWAVHLCVGHLHGRFPWRETALMLSGYHGRHRFPPDMRGEIEALLRGRFGWIEEDILHALDHYVAHWLPRLIIRYNREAANMWAATK